MLVEFPAAAGLAELIDAQRNRPCAEHGSKERKGVGMAVDDGNDRTLAFILGNQVFEQGRGAYARVLGAQTSGLSPAAIKEARRAAGRADSTALTMAAAEIP